MLTISLKTDWKTVKQDRKVSLATVEINKGLVVGVLGVKLIISYMKPEQVATTTNETPKPLINEDAMDDFLDEDEPEPAPSDGGTKIKVKHIPSEHDVLNDYIET